MKVKLVSKITLKFKIVNKDQTLKSACINFSFDGFTQDTGKIYVCTIMSQNCLS